MRLTRSVSSCDGGERPSTGEGQGRRPWPNSARWCREAHYRTPGRWLLLAAIVGLYANGWGSSPAAAPTTVGVTVPGCGSSVGSFRADTEAHGPGRPSQSSKAFGWQ